MINKIQEPFERGAGTLLPVASLPSNYGIGTFGKAAYDFVDFLHKSGQKYWQVLPIGPTGYGDSPYQSFSAFAGNPYFIDFDFLIEENLLDISDIEKINWGDNPSLIDYGKIYENRYSVLRVAFKNFNTSDESFIEFCDANSFWLDDYSDYMAIKDLFKGVEWLKWPEDIRNRDKDALENYRIKLSDDIMFWKFLQFKFIVQLNQLKKYAHNKNITIIGDIPIYVALDSSDVWANLKEFQMDESKKPTMVAGVPPDMFSSTGQLWGNPLYDWDYMKADNFSWWRKRMKYSALLYDIIRIDHFIGIVHYYSIKYGEETAMNGFWKDGPGHDLINSINEEIGSSKIIAEDLGVVTQKVKQLLKDSGYPGMRLLQFGFDSDARNENLAKHCPSNSVVYGGTHDNETLRGYFQNLDSKSRAKARKMLDIKQNRFFVWKVIESGFKSKANTVIFQIQDYLELDNSARMNVPSTIGGNWCWRLLPSQISDDLIHKIENLIKITKR